MYFPSALRDHVWHLFVTNCFLDEIRSVEGTPAERKTSYIMDRVLDHISHGFPCKLDQMFPREKCTSNLPYVSIAKLKEELNSPPVRIKEGPSSSSIANPAQEAVPAATQTPNNLFMVSRWRRVEEDPFQGH